jgi:hypothetical protein
MKINRKNMSRIFGFVLLSSAMMTTAAAQPYKVGDKHPDGGIVAIVNPDGKSGVVIDEKDGTYTPPEAIAAGRAKGPGWVTPSIKDLRTIYQNRNEAKGNFQPAVYLAGDASSAQYRRGMDFKTGTEVTNIGQGDKRLVRFVRGFKPGLREAITSSRTTYEGDWSWADDDTHAKNHSKLVVKSATEYDYVYKGKTYNLTGKMSYSGGDPNAPLALNLDLPDGNHLRFQWNSADAVEGHFWKKGMKAGLTKNNTPETIANMKRVPSK